MNQKNNLFGWKHATLWRISLWANVLAPIVLFVSILLIANLIARYNQFARSQFNLGLLEWLSQNPDYAFDLIAQTGRSLLSGAVYYVFLKGVALAFDILIETDLNYREKSQIIPNQENESVEQKATDKTADGLEKWEEKLLDDNNQPELYDTLKVLELRDKINRAGTGIVIAWILIALLNFQVIKMLLHGTSISYSDLEKSIQPMLVTSLTIAVQIATTYLPLKALSHVLRILMEMEFNSRKADT